MIKADLVNEIAIKTGIDRVPAEAIVNGIMDVIRKAAINGENIYLREFGTFHIVKRAAKSGRNINKGTAVNIPAHNTVKFKPSKEFANKVRAKLPPK